MQQYIKELYDDPDELEELEIEEEITREELEEEITTEELGPPITKAEFEKALKELK